MTLIQALSMISNSSILQRVNTPIRPQHPCEEGRSRKAPAVNSTEVFAPPRRDFEYYKNNPAFKSAPYTEEQIRTALREDYRFKSMGKNFLDDHRFQQKEFTKFFNEVESGKLHHGEPSYTRSATYLLKKQFEMLVPPAVKTKPPAGTQAAAAHIGLAERARNVWERFDRLIQDASTDIQERLADSDGDLDRLKVLVQGIRRRVEELEQAMLPLLENPENYQPHRDKVNLFVFLHAMLSDAVRAAEERLDYVEGKSLSGGDLLRDEDLIVQCVVEGRISDDLFSPGDLSTQGLELYGECTDRGISLARLPSRDKIVPIFTRTGALGLNTILSGAVDGVGLLPASSDAPYGVHGNLYRSRHTATLSHDVDHIKGMSRIGLLDGPAWLGPIFKKLIDPDCELPEEVVQQHLVLLFYLVHEDYGFASTGYQPDFLSFFRQGDTLPDFIPLLNSVCPDLDSDKIPPVSHYDRKNEREAMAKAYKKMDQIWEDFSARHAKELAVDYSPAWRKNPSRQPQPPRV